MDIFNNCIKLQNIEILKLIADNKFTNETDKINFINKYNKDNYQRLVIVKEDMTKSYNKKVNKLLNCG
jgi:hypothetical protein